MCYECHEDDIDKSVGKLSSVADGVMKALTFSKREEVKAWEQEFIPCEHTLCLIPQVPREGQSIGKLHDLILTILKFSSHDSYRSSRLLNV
jgi:ubiquitin carboxyl-terminal hydrolase 5/13